MTAGEGDAAVEAQLRAVHATVTAGRKPYCRACGTEPPCLVIRALDIVRAEGVGASDPGSRQRALIDLEHVGALAVESVVAEQGETVRASAMSRYREDLLAIGATEAELDTVGIVAQ